MPLYFVYAYNMRDAEDKWCLLCCTRIISYHEEVRPASWEVTRLINDDTSDPDECFAIGAVPLGAVHEHNLV